MVLQLGTPGAQRHRNRSAAGAPSRAIHRRAPQGPRGQGRTTNRESPQPWRFGRQIAAREGLSLKRVRNLVREILGQRMPRHRRSSSRFRSAASAKALLVFYTAMHGAIPGANFHAIDRVVRIVQGSSTAVTDMFPTRRPTRAKDSGLSRRRKARSRSKPRSPSDSELAPQPFEKARFGLGKQAASLCVRDPLARG
jgi:hypothetical protein